MLNTIYICSQYDDLYFQKQFFEFIPSIDHFFAGTSLESGLNRFVASYGIAGVSNTAIKLFMSSFEKFILENKNDTED